MKCKLSKLFFLVLMGSVAVKGYSQTEAERKKITESYDLVKLNNLAKDFEESYKINYDKAVEVAKQRNMPISGVGKDGVYFSLIKLDEQTNELIYYSTKNNVEVGSSLQTANAKPLNSLGITGSGMTAGVWDGGAAIPNHFSLVGRTQIKDNGSAGFSSTAISHATHVTGTVIANNFIPSAKGFAPQGSVWSYNWTSDESEMTNAAAQGLLVSNHSYGIDASQAGSAIPGIFGRYDVSSRAYDLIANAAPYYTMVFAAGNDRQYGYNPGKGGRDLLSQGGVSKNTVVVAATKGTEDFSGITGLSSPISFLASFSSWGPTDDFRIKPDISAKGDNVFSLHNSGTGATDIKSGTSMAAPAVTGVFLLWQQYHNQLFGSFMKSSAVRALMAHTAKEAGEANGPDYKFGWGLIDADAGAQIMREKQINKAVFEDVTLNNQSVFEYVFTSDGVKPLKVTIAWNDPAGSALNTLNVNLASLVNDLDLRVINNTSEQVYLPWALNFDYNSSGSGIASKKDNNRDNIEKVELGIVPAGEYKVRVNHKGNLNGGSQVFSLIVSGAGDNMPLLSETKFEFDNLNIYPNPTNSVLNISADFDQISGANIGVFDISGRKIYSDNNLFSNSDSATLDVSGFSKGIYLLEIVNKSNRQVVKFVVK